MSQSASSDIRIINPIDFKEWDDLILARPDYSFFHSSAWARVLSESYGYKPLYFTIFDGNAISACLPVMEVNSFITGKRGVSLPFSDYCEPLIDNPYQYEILLASGKEYTRKARWKYLDLRGGHRFLGNEPSMATYFGHLLDLRVGEEALLAGLRDSTRRNTRKAQKKGVEIRVSDTLEAMTTFYDLHVVTRRCHGLPPQPFGFFHTIHRNVLLKGLGMIVLAYYRETPVAGSIFFHFGRKAMYKYGASSPDYQRLRPNNLVMWSAIEWFSRRDFESLCLGRTDTDHDGLRQFKTGWGVKEYLINHHRYNPRKNIFFTRQSLTDHFVKTIFGKLPIPVLKIIGSFAYKHTA